MCKPMYTALLATSQFWRRVPGNVNVWPLLERSRKLSAKLVPQQVQVGKRFQARQRVRDGACQRIV